jgi:hypothetical protein
LSESLEGSPSGSLSHREAYLENTISDLRASGISACMRLFFFLSQVFKETRDGLRVSVVDVDLGWLSDFP